MLRHILSFLCALLLTACQMTAPENSAGATNPITGGAIVVTPLDAPLAEPPDAAAVKEDQPAPVPDEAVAKPVAEVSPPAAAAAPAEAAVPAAEATPAVLKSPAQVQCEKQGGTWARAGKSAARTCVQQTRDGGKQCTRGTQCEGLCLARSGTCAPLAPLFGCNEILEDDGRRVTLCID